MALTISGVKLSQTSPAFLHANSTSHTWPFSAIAEIIDNAYDPDVSASQLFIDVEEKFGEKCLIFMDDGNGMTPEKLHKMLSFGYCEKVEIAGHKPVGHYGNGFKSGSMRLGKDAIVFTKVKQGTVSVGFLSQTYLSNIGATTVLIPMVTWDANTNVCHWNLNFSAEKLIIDDSSNDSLKAITQHSIFTSEEALLKEMVHLEMYESGTRIIIYNLKRSTDGKLELDFQSKSNDIINSERQEMDFSSALRPVMDYVPEYRRSLREYCSILFLKPRMKIILRQQKVKTKLISKSLSRTEKDYYKPMYLKKPVKIIFGFSDSMEDFGLMMYHRNRLIKAYEHVGCQKKANDHGIGVVGVVEVDFLEPIHNKQDFNKTDRYNAFINAAGLKLNDYWYTKTRTGISSEQRCKSDWTWVQCENCLKWRRLPDGFTDEGLPDNWFCYMNPDPTHNRCDIDEEHEDEDEFEVKPSYNKVKKKSGLYRQSADLEAAQMRLEMAPRLEMDQQALVQRLQDNCKQIEHRRMQVRNNIMEQHQGMTVLNNIARYGGQLQPSVGMRGNVSRMNIPQPNGKIVTTSNQREIRNICKIEPGTSNRERSVPVKGPHRKRRRSHDSATIILIDSDDENNCVIIKNSVTKNCENHSMRKTENGVENARSQSSSSWRATPDNARTESGKKAAQCVDKQTQTSVTELKDKDGDDEGAEGSDGGQRTSGGGSDTSNLCRHCGRVKTDSDTKDSVELLQQRLEETTSKLTGLRSNVRKLLQTILTDIQIENLEFIDPIVSEMVRVNGESSNSDDK